jgi:hypothetical protein
MVVISRSGTGGTDFGGVSYYRCRKQYAKQARKRLAMRGWQGPLPRAEATMPKGPLPLPSLPSFPPVQGGGAGGGDAHANASNMANEGGTKEGEGGGEDAVQDGMRVVWTEDAGSIDARARYQGPSVAVWK